MRVATIDPRVLGTVRAALADGPWLEGEWDEHAMRHARAMLATLRESLGAFAVPTAVAAGHSAAQAEAPLQSGAYFETWSKVTLVWAVRQLAREALEARVRGENTAGELGRIAGELAVAARSLGGRSDTPSATARECRLDRVVSAARQELTNARAEAELDIAGDEALGVCLDQLKHTLSILANGGRAADGVLRGAIARADRTLTKRNAAAWVGVALPARAALARQGVIETAAALALAVPGEYGPAPANREACLWLARTACEIAACAPAVDGWLAASAAESDGPGAASDTTTPAATVSDEDAKVSSSDDEEAPMKDTAVSSSKSPILETLKVDATDAAWRTAGSQFVKLARDPLAALLSRHLAPEDESLRNKIAAFLQTEVGTAILASMLSLGLSALPGGATGEVGQRLSRELRVRAMADAGDLVAEIVMGPLRQVMALYLQDPGGAVLSAQPAALSASNGVKIPANVVAMPEREAAG